MEIEMVAPPVAQQQTEQEIVEAPVTQQLLSIPQQQQTVTERCFTWLITTIFMLQLVSIPFLSMFLLIQGPIINHSTHFKPLKWYPPLLISVVVSGLLSSVWNYLFHHKIRVTVIATIWLAPILTGLVGTFLIWLSTSMATLIGDLLVLFAIAQSCYGWFINSRLIYTNSILLNSAGSPPPKTYEVVSYSVFYSLLYSTIVITGIGGATCRYTRTGTVDILFISILMTSLTWTIQVLKTMQHVPISMTRYLDFTSNEKVQLWDAVAYTLDTQWGSICIGSILVPLIELLRGSIRSYYRVLLRTDEAMYNSTERCASIANNVIKYGNQWGFLGIYETGFVQASSDMWNTFRETVGLEQLIDFDITSSICFFSAIAVGAASALFAGFFTVLIHKDYVLELTLYAFIFGYLVGRVSVAWVEACITGYYGAYADEPQSQSFDDTIPWQIQLLQMQNGR